MSQTCLIVTLEETVMNMSRCVTRVGLRVFSMIGLVLLGDEMKNYRVITHH